MRKSHILNYVKTFVNKFTVLTTKYVFHIVFSFNHILQKLSSNKIPPVAGMSVWEATSQAVNSLATWMIEHPMETPVPSSDTQPGPSSLETPPTPPHTAPRQLTLLISLHIGIPFC